ncbi:MAG TPA: flagellar hook-associated protein FlgL [Terriglobales bacterium]|nr:flagellar hook-associated protein FlgL [Terriglobales bacterium]
MLARVTNSMMNNNLLEALNQTQQGQNNALTQVETQLRVNLPSDDPAAAALYSTSLAVSAQNTQYLQNINSLNGNMQVGDAALSSAVSILNRAITLGTEGGNGTLSASDEHSLGQEVGQLQQQMLGVANSTFQGNAIFAGTASGPAYVADASSPDGVSYQGNTNVNQVEIAAGSKVPVNVPGSQIFQNGSGSVFQALQDLKTALASNDPAAAQTAVNGINAALSQLSQQRVFYGSTIDRLNSTQAVLNNEQTALTQQQTTLVGADMATSITQLYSAEVARSAILAAGARLSQISLLTQAPTVG